MNNNNLKIMLRLVNNFKLIKLDSNSKIRFKIQINKCSLINMDNNTS